MDRGGDMMISHTQYANQTPFASHLRVENHLANANPSLATGYLKTTKKMRVITELKPIDSMRASQCLKPNENIRNVLSENLEQPSCRAINTPKLVAHSPFGRAALSFANAGALLSILIELVMIALYKNVIVYENSSLILGFEIILAIVMFILNIKEGLK